MVSVNRKVLDISHWNTVASWTGVRDAGIRGIIAKATEGTGYIDDTFVTNRAGSLANGLLFGAYHFANNSNVQQQVDHFLGVTGIDERALYALDWEDEPNGRTMSLAQAREFLELMGERIGRFRCVLYSGNRAKEELGNDDDEFFGRHRLWLAQYGNSPVTQASWEQWWLWQYSDGVYGPGPHGCPGVSGDVDTNSWDSSDAALAAQWSGSVTAPAPTPPNPRPALARVDITTQGDVTVSVNGVVISPEQCCERPGRRRSRSDSLRR